MDLSNQELEELEIIARPHLTIENGEIVSVDWGFATNEFFPQKNEVLKYLIHKGILSILKDGNYGLLADDVGLNPVYRVNTVYFTELKHAEDFKKCCYAEVDYPISIIKYIATD